MEFKSLEKWRVQNKFSISEKDLDVIIKRMIKRHPLEEWVYSYLAPNGQYNSYLKLEFVEWLEEVHFNKDDYYLDAEIKFFKKQISRLEKELSIPPKETIYNEMTIRELSNYFNKTINCLYMAIGRMRKTTNIPIAYDEDGKIIVPKEGVKWLHENYFRKDFLKSLELYKLKLQQQKRELYG